MTPPKARRIQPPAPQLDARADYADAFEIPIGEGDSRTAEQAFRDGLGAERVHPDVWCYGSTAMCCGSGSAPSLPPTT